MQPLVAGLLLAVSVGALALALVRILLFLAGGLAGLVVIQTVAPALDEPLACFLAGGLLGVLLYRFWVAALTSLAGTLLMGYSGLCLLERFTKVNSVALTQQHGPLLNWGCAFGAGLGLLVQFLLERRHKRRQKQREEAKNAAAETAKLPPPPPPPPPRLPWWKWPTRFAQGKKAA